ncbi:MAG: hypothetical protein ACAI38_12625 [Myxococcota bacterium]|nr:hypothetical protein [Myxococcota bacterium]
MSSLSQDVDAVADGIVARADQRFTDLRNDNFRRIDRMFFWLLLGQWLFGILIAVTVSPRAWDGTEWHVHQHVYAAIFLGLGVAGLPMTLTWLYPGRPLTRHVAAASQVLFSALLIHLTGGRIETHFHVFGSLAFIAFYRDWRPLITASVIVAADHFLRGWFWPESVYGVASPEWWRFIEHAMWVVFIDAFLVLSCAFGVRDFRAMAEQTAQVEALAEHAIRGARPA